MEAAVSDALPLVIIVGPTASGKTGLAITLAKQFGGEVISADSRAIYRGLDIGTAKPTLEEQQGVPHWGIDIVDPGERFTAADFQSYALQKIDEIRARGHVPFLVGGTGLYVDAIMYNFHFPAGGDDLARRAQLESLEIVELHEYCYKNNIILPENKWNKRYVVNSILRNNQNLQRRSEPLDNSIVVGIATEKQTLRERIHMRARIIFDGAVIDEAQKAAEQFGWNNEAMTGNIYPLIHLMTQGKMTKKEAIEKFEILDWHLAKRQLTWLKRNEHIMWLSLDEAYTYLAWRLEDVFNS